MAHRSKKGQEVHDAKVQEVARRLEREGFDVQADLPGHPRPPTIGGHIPDIVASKAGKTLIREVETPGTVKTDKPQQEALREAAEEQGADFRVLVAKPKKP